MDASKHIDTSRDSFNCRYCSMRPLCHPVELNATEQLELDQLTETQTTIGKGATLFNAGEVFRGLYVIRSGAFKYVHPEANHESKILAFYLPGDFFGFDAIHSKHYPASAVALEDSSICFIPYAKLLSALAKLPALQSSLLEITSEKFNRQQHSQLHHLPADQRLMGFITSLSQHFKSRGFSASRFHFPMSRKDMANYLDLAPETISRLLADFQKQGVMKVANKNVDLLESVA